MKLRYIRHKKAGMQISINTIVILILAVTILGVGLKFINDMLKPAFEDIDQQREQRRNEFIEELKESGERFTWDMNFNEMKKAEKKTVFFGVKNELEDTMAFGVTFGCTNAINGEAVPKDDITFEYFEDTEEVKEDYVAVDTVIIKVEPTAKSTIYRCRVVIGIDGYNFDVEDLDDPESTDEQEDDYYDSHSFQIRVK